MNDKNYITRKLLLYKKQKERIILYLFIVLVEYNSTLQNYRLFRYPSNNPPSAVMKHPQTLVFNRSETTYHFVKLFNIGVPLWENALVELYPFDARLHRECLSTIANDFSAVFKSSTIVRNRFIPLRDDYFWKAESYPRGKSWEGGGGK